MNPSAARVLDYIVNYKAEHDGLSPTYENIAEHLGIVSKAYVSYLVAKLVKVDAVRLLRNGNRVNGIMVVGGQWSYQDSPSAVAAGDR